MVEEPRIYRGVNSGGFYIVCWHMRLGLIYYSITWGWQLLKMTLPTDPTEDPTDFSYYNIAPSSPLEMLVVSGLGIEQVLRQGELMKVGQVVWIK